MEFKSHKLVTDTNPPSDLYQNAEPKSTKQMFYFYFRFRMNNKWKQKANRRTTRHREENRGAHSCHGCMIITDSSVIEDLLTAFHYQQQTYSETESRRGERRNGGGGGGRFWGRLPQDGRVSEGIRKRKEGRCEKRRW